MKELVERIEKLEQENLRLRQRRRRAQVLLTFLLSLGFGISIMIGAGAVQKVVVRAEAFYLEDENGQVRALWEVTPDGPTLCFFHGEDPRLSIGLARDGAAVVDFLHMQEPRLQLSVSSDGWPQWRLFDPNRDPRIVTAVTREGNAGLRVNGKQNSTSADLTVQSNGDAILSLYSQEKPEEHSRIIMMAQPAGQAGLGLYGLDGRNAISVRALPDGSSDLRLRGRTSEHPVKIRVSSEGAPSMLLPDRTGKPLFQAPSN